MVFNEYLLSSLQFWGMMIVDIREGTVIWRKCLAHLSFGKRFTRLSLG